MFINKVLEKEKANTDSVNSLEYVPYSKDELAFAKNLPGPKLSNYEKSILRRHRYGEVIVDESTSDEK